MIKLERFHLFKSAALFSALVACIILLIFFYSKRFSLSKECWQERLEVTVQAGHGHLRKPDWLQKFVQREIEGVLVFLPQSPSNTSQKCREVEGSRVVVTYGSHDFYLAQAIEACQKSISIDDIDVCLVVTAQFLEESFKQQNAKLFKQLRGGGYWVWKPYILLRLLFLVDEGDVLFYLDADTFLINPIEQHICLQAHVRQDIVLFYLQLAEYIWSKADAFYIMNVEDIPHINDTAQISACFMMFRKSFYSVRFVSDWLAYSQDDRVNTDRASQLRKEHTAFKENRHDQTALSLLAKRWGIPSWPSPKRSWNNTQTSKGDLSKPFKSLDLQGNVTVPSMPIIGSV